MFVYIFDKKNAKKYSDCIIVYFPNGHCDLFVEREFAEEMVILIEELDDEFIKNGYEKYYGTIIKDICPYNANTRCAVYVKKI